MPFLAPAPPRVLAHRGLALDAPENTLLAFERALAVGATHLETDVHVSRDGVAVVSHDPDLSRLVGRPARVGDLTMAELRAIDLGSGQGYVSMAEAFDAFPHARFNIDVKIAGAAAPLVAAIREAGAVDRVLIGSFSASRRLAVTRELPGVATSVSSGGAVAAVRAANTPGGVPLVRRILRDVDAVQLPLRILGMPTVTPRTMAAFHAAGVEVHLWTINDPAEMDRLLALGVDGLVSDRADLAVAAVERHLSTRS